MAARLGRRLCTSLEPFRIAVGHCHRTCGIFRTKGPTTKFFSNKQNLPRLLFSSSLKTNTYLFSSLASKRINSHCSCKCHYATSPTDPHEEPRQHKTQSPYHLVQKELSTIYEDIRVPKSSPQRVTDRDSKGVAALYYRRRCVEQLLRLLFQQLLRTSKKDLQDLAQYYFDGQGKTFRPMVVLLISRAFNLHNRNDSNVTPSQRQVALITEMIHTASLVHDDVIDGSDTRRNKPSVNSLWGQRNAILAGDFILSVAAMTLARIRNEEVVIILSQVIEDLVRGEFMQLGSKENENERFSHYLKKTFKKTASLLANSCKAVAVLGNCEEDLTEVAFQYGRHLGIAFQLIDDLLDYVSSDAVLGKPTTADLKLGLATAPVLFAAQEYPELDALIMRRFSKEGDVEQAVDLVKKSDGVRQTRMLAERHCQEAVRLIQQLTDSPARNALIEVTELVLRRDK